VAGDKRSYYRLFGGYLLALIGGGVAVVGLAIAAFDLAGGEAEAAAVIGAAFALKTLAYVAGGPLAAALLGGLPRRPVLVTLDLVRAAAILGLPFVTAVWQLYALILAFALASAAFTPIYQAVVPRLLPDPAAYAASLGRSRLAAELDGAVAPLIAAGLLATVGLRGLFVAAMAAFIVSALLIGGARLGAGAQESPAEGVARLWRGVGALFAAPALRGLGPLALAVGLVTATVTVETAPLVMGRLGRGPEAAAWALAAFGAGSAAAAVALPRLMAALSPRQVMLGGGAAMALALAAASGVSLYATLLAVWAAVGAGAALALSPAGALIRSVATREQQPSIYTAHFAVANAAAALGYALAGAFGRFEAFDAGALATALAALAAVGAAARLWRPAPG
jgi:MFS family permease